ncbi:ATP-binding cassette domain-containing protein [Microbacterium sp. KSW2-22]|uniref:ABC transporter ATP-binding protein n=1 Tax=Microbacterium aquilitoris TaxID=3067307 RepID=UPI00289065D1|nr:ATP-binding cassette domain-containing protein [Microbacterium sp. KSW2-22]MDT3344162.1 ATP-binding cassette domain-containing protein [Microbacterium sp. KSW2-22]
MSGAGTAVPPPPEVPAAVAAAELPGTPVDADAPEVPPKPEIPASVAAARFEEPIIPDEEPQDLDEGTDVANGDSDPIPETEPVAEAEPEPVKEVEPEPTPEAEPEPVIEPESPADTHPEVIEVLEETEVIEVSNVADVSVPTDAAEVEEPSDDVAVDPLEGPGATDTNAPTVAFEVEEAEELAPEAPATAVMPQMDAEVETDASEETTRPTPALRMTDVSKSFGRTRAVDAVDLEIPAGSFYGIVGPNGAGKTTTLSMIAGLLRPDGGTIEVGGIDLRRDPRGAKALMGVLPDRLRTFERLTGRQLLHYYGVLRGLRGAVVAERTEDLGRAFDLTAALARPVSDYSAGMTKKIMLAGAMIHAPRLLVLDEPFEAVDPVSSEVILDILSAYVARGGTVVLSSHGMELVERVCDGVAVIVSGQVLAQGTVDEVRGDHTLAERFMQLSGGLSDVEGLEWLHTYSD